MNGSLVQVRRFDRGSLVEYGRDEGGMLRVRARPAKVGVYPYQSRDGTIHHELTSAETLFDADWLASMAMRPVTLDHPPELVTADNAKKYQIGTTGEIIGRDGDFMTCTILVSDSRAVAAIEGGRLELSCGYTCLLDWTPGTWQGQSYDAIQRQRRGNHVAIVGRGRHGPGARIAMDALDDEAAYQMEDGMKLKLDDGTELDGAEAILAHIKNLDTKVNTATAEVAASKSEASEVRTKLDAKTAELVALQAQKDAGADAVTAARMAGASEARARVALEAQAVAILGDAKGHDGKTDADVRKAIVGKLKPSVSLDGKTDAEVAAIFEVVVADSKDSIEAARRRAALSDKTDKHPSDDPVRRVSSF